MGAREMALWLTQFKQASSFPRALAHSKDRGTSALASFPEGQPTPLPRGFPVYVSPCAARARSNPCLVVPLSKVRSDGSGLGLPMGSSRGSSSRQSHHGEAFAAGLSERDHTQLATQRICRG